jgi:predicted pyridoxine 5'-phosphate oxidase superfamily flavin-nucleotide-binding protein
MDTYTLTETEATFIQRIANQKAASLAMMQEAEAQHTAALLLIATQQKLTDPSNPGRVNFDASTNTLSKQAAPPAPAAE